MDRYYDAASGTVFRNSTCFQRNKQKLYIYVFLYKKVFIIVQNENLQNENTQLGAERVKETWNIEKLEKSIIIPVGGDE